MKIFFKLSGLSLIMLFASCKDPDKSIELHNKVYAELTAKRIVAALKYNDIKILPKRASERLRLVDLSVHKYINEVDSMSLVVESEGGSEEIKAHYYLMEAADDFISGFDKRNTNQALIDFVVLWKMDADTYWRGFAVECMLSDGEIYNEREIKDVDDSWVSKNLIIFPKKGDMTFELISQNHSANGEHAKGDTCKRGHARMARD